MHALHAAVVNLDPIDIALDPHIDAAVHELLVHQRDQPVGATLEREHSLGHEIREDDAVGDRGIFERGPVGVGDRLHQQANHVLAAWEKPLEQLADRRRLIVVESSCRGQRRRTPARFRPASWNCVVNSRVKSSRLNVVVSENIGLSKRMFLSCTIESAISWVQ